MRVGNSRLVLNIRFLIFKSSFLFASLFRNRVAAGEETGLSGILDLKSGQSSKGSKLESALDKLGLQKRKVEII